MQLVHGRHIVEYIVAGENLTQNDAVYIDDGAGARTVGQVYKLDVTTATREKFVGIVKETVTTGNQAIVIIMGKVDTFSALTPGDILYASLTVPGSYQTTEPANHDDNILIIGVTTEADTVFTNASLMGSLRPQKIAYKNNLQATVAPTTGDDTDDGYSIGSMWYNKNTSIVYMASDVTGAAAVWNEISSSGGGGGSGTIGDAETIHLIVGDDIVIGDVDLSGNNTDFDGGGTITASSLTLSTTAADLLKGSTQVIKYSPAADGSDDYFGFTKSIPLAFRGRTLGFQFEFKNSATTVDDDFRFCVKIKDGALAGNIQYFNMETHSSNNTGKTAKYTSFVPEDCTAIEFGYQNTSATTTVQLFVDNILVSSNAFIDKNITEMVEWTSYIPTFQGLGTPSGVDFRWRRVGQQMEIQGHLITGTTTASEAQISLPNSETISSDIGTSPARIGMVGQSSTSTSEYYMLGTSGDAFLNMGIQSSGVGGLTISDGSTMFGASRTISFYASIPIAGWQAEKEAVIHVDNVEFQELRHTATVGTLVAGGTAGTEIAMNLGNISTIGGNVIETSNVTNGVNLVTRFTALTPVALFVVVNTYSTRAIGLTWLELYKNGSFNNRGSQSANVSNQYMAGVDVIYLNAGDWMSIYTPWALNTSAPVTVSVMAIPTARTIITPLTQTINLQLRTTGNVGSSITEAIVPITHIDELDASSVAKTSKFAKLENDQLFLPAGTYYWDYHQVLYGSQRAAVWLENTTASTEHFIAHSYGNNNLHNYFIPIKGWFTITEASLFEIRHEVDVANAAGLGWDIHSLTHGAYTVSGTGSITKIL